MIPHRLRVGRLWRENPVYTVRGPAVTGPAPVGGPGTCEAYSFGSNGEKQLGLQHDNDISTPELCLTFPRAMANADIFINSGNCTFFLGDDCVGNHVSLVFGNKPPANLPVSNNRIHNMSPTMAAATWDTFAVACRGPEAPWESQIIRTFGSSDKGQLGRPPELDPNPNLDNSTAAAVVDNCVIDIAAGVQHFVAILYGHDDTRTAIGWGNGRKGQLGEPAQAVVERPRVIEGIDFEIWTVFCGREFTVFLGDPEEGHICVLGSDKFGIRSKCPKNVKGWKQGGAGWGSVTILLADGSIVSWGRNDHGQLAPKGLPLIDMISVGSEHTVAITRPRIEGEEVISAQVIAWGWGEHGNCGPDVDANGDVKDRWTVIPVPQRQEGTSSNTQAPIRRPIGVVAGHATSWFWVEETDPS